MVSIVADFRERGLDDLTSDVDQLVRKFRDLKKTADTLGTDNLTKVLLAQAKASQQAARATAEQARAEQQRQRTQQVSLKTAQQTAKAELAKAKAQTESARTTREIARAEQEQSKVSQQRLKTQQQALKVETELSRAQQQAAKVLVEQARATREAAKAAQTAARAREVEGTATKTAAQRLKEYTDANLRLAKAANLPLSSVKQLTRELGVTPQRAEQLVRRFNELQSSGSRAANTFKVLSRETGISARQFLALQKSIGVSTRDLQNLSTIGAATGLALARIFSGAGSTFVDFQRNIQGAAVRAGETLESFEGVREEAARLGATTSLTAGDISQTVDQLSRMGFTSDQTEASLSGLVQGAEGAGEALTTVTNVAGRAINQFGLTASSAGNVTDILVTAANAADVSVSTLGESLKFAGTVANSANQSLEDTTFLLALAGNAGLRGGQAGRNFVSFLQRLDIASAASNSQLAGLARGSQRAADALAVLGSKVRDETTGELKSMRELLPILRDDLVNLRETSPGDFGIVTKALFGTQGRRFADAIIGATDEDLAQLEERFGSLEGASARSSKALQEGLPGALRQLQSASEGLELRAFQEFAGLSEILVRSLTGVIRGFQELDPRIQSFLIQTTSIGALLVTAVGALSAFNLALRTLQPIQSAQAAVTQLQNIRLAAQAAVSATATAAQNAYAIATGKATAVQKQQVAAFAAQAARAGLFAGAIAAVSLAVGQYNEIQASTADTARAVEVVDEAYQKLIETQARAAEGAESAARAEESVARNAAAITDNLGPISTTLDTILRGPLNGIVEQVDNVLQKAIDFLPIPDQIKDALLGLVPGFTAIETVAGNFATAGETATNRQIIKFGELIKSTQDVEGAYFDVIQTLEQGGDVDPAALNDLQAAINASIISLEEARPITTEDLKLRDAQIRRFQTAKERLDEYTSATDDAAAATDDLGDSITSSIEGLSEGLEAELALVERDQARAAAELAEQAGLSEAERQERALSAQQDGQSQRLAAAKQYYENIEQLAAEDPGNLELQDELINAETAYYQAREELAKTSAEERQSVEDAALEQTKSAIADAEAAAEAAATSRARSLLQLEQQLRTQGATETEIAEQVAQERLAIDEQGIRDQIALEQQKIDSFAEGTDEQKEAIAAKAELENDLLKNQIDAEKQFRDDQIAAIERTSEAQQAAVDLAVEGAELQLGAFSRIEQSLERQSTLLSEQANLQEAIAGLRSSVAAGEEDDAKSALDLIRERNELDADAEGSAERRKQINQELARLGFGRQNEAQIETELLSRTRERFELERQQQERRQRTEALSLEFEIRKNQIAAQRVVTEQQIALARLEGQRQALVGEIEIARVRGDDQAVQQGQAALGILDQQIASQGQLVGLAQENLQLERERANEQRASLAAKQQEEDVDLARSQLATANTLDRDVDSGTSGQLARQAQQRADAEEREAEALANNLDALVKSDSELQQVAAQAGAAADETGRLADEAERYLSALQAAPQAVPGQIPGFKAGGTPEGVAIVGEGGPEIGFYPKGTRIISNPQARRWVQEAAAANPANFSSFMRSPIMPSAARSTGSVKAVGGDKDLIKAMQTLGHKLDKFQGGYVHNGPQTNRMTMSKELLKQTLGEMADQLSGQVAVDLKRRWGIS